MTISVNKVSAYEDGGVSLMARHRGNDGAYITRTSLNSISVKVFDKSDPSTTLQSTTLNVSTVVFDTLQTDTRWTKDSTGYNFRHDVPGSWLESGNKTYRIEYKFDPVAGEDFFLVFEVRTANILGS